MKLPVFISMTVISERVKILDQVLTGLLNQTYKPDRIIINVSIDAHMLDEGVTFEKLPVYTRKRALSGEIEVYFCRNTGPYRKIIPTVRRFSNLDCLIATADDDVNYPPEWLEQLVELSMRHSAVVAYRCRLMEFDAHNLQPYEKWNLIASHDQLRSKGIDPSIPEKRLFPTGRDGVIYHSRHLEDFDSLCELATMLPTQDDIALKFLTLLAGVPVIVAERRKTSFSEGFEFPGISGGAKSLWGLNANGANDAAINSVLNWCQSKFDFNVMDIA